MGIGCGGEGGGVGCGISGGGEGDVGEGDVWFEEEDDMMGFPGLDICGLERIGPSDETMFCWA